MLSRMIIQIAPELKSKTECISKLEGKSASQLVGELFEDYVRHQYIGYYISVIFHRRYLV
ncbi:MAG: hypothetical protein AUJ48_02915 [Deltaproteobacteria bacterium CG1_02_45_11]|nr:MAG: hypothetical protein AUJ48_02915 [Deltaproteobacteria bacterium CG1_02_45_11]